MSKRFRWRVAAVRIGLAGAFAAGVVGPAVTAPDVVGKASAMVGCDIFMCGSNHSQVLL
jgi:hypothetical protein